MRGNRLLAERHQAEHGSIPARAGEPVTNQPDIEKSTVYPRACGGTAVDPEIVTFAYGLSPRVRGNPFRRQGAGGERGSIPARAGEPDRPDRCRCFLRVYPRACGGTACMGERLPSYLGLSPRVRGNLIGCRVDPAGIGSIPARAGKPDQLAASEYPGGVYPRACGETLSSALRPRPRTGLSPRVRGNRPPAS